MPALARLGCVLSYCGCQLLTNLLLPFGIGHAQETQQTCSLEKGLLGDSLVVWEQQLPKLEKPQFLPLPPSVADPTGLGLESFKICPLENRLG